jgi:hypothetical protein
MTLVEHAARAAAAFPAAPVPAVRAKLRVSTRSAEALVAELGRTTGTLFEARP